MGSTAETRAARLLLHADRNMDRLYPWALACSPTTRLLAAEIGRGVYTTRAGQVGDALREWAEMVSEVAMSFLDAAEALDDLAEQARQEDDPSLD